MPVCIATGNFENFSEFVGGMALRTVYIVEGRSFILPAKPGAWWRVQIDNPVK
jgi:hypothetical protein